MTPSLKEGEVLGALADELDHVAIPTVAYTIEDHQGDEHQVLGPASDAKFGHVSMERLRAWRKVGLAKLNKEMELLPPPEMRKLGSVHGPDWPSPSALAGLSSPGARGAGKSVDITLYLKVERFGIAPKEEAELNEKEVAVPDPQEIPPLPSFHRDGGASITISSPRLANAQTSLIARGKRS